MEPEEPLVALAGEAEAGIGATVPLALQTDGVVAFAVAAASGAMAGGVLVYAAGALSK